MDRLSTLAWYHLLWFGVMVPVLAVLTRGRLMPAGAPPDRMKHFRSTAIELVVFGSFSWFTARSQSVDLFTADASRILTALPAAFAMYVVAVVLMRPRWRRAVTKRARIVYLFMPSNATERMSWLSVSILAGVTEELTWRGVQTTLLTLVTGHIAPAAFICAVMFALGHIVQGWRTAIVVSIFALAFQGLVWLSGSLYVAMAVHAAYDITAGLTYGRLGRQLGYEASEVRELSSSPPHASGTPL